jgi:hypothetical protein
VRTLVLGDKRSRQSLGLRRGEARWGVVLGRPGDWVPLVAEARVRAVDGFCPGAYARNPRVLGMGRDEGVPTIVAGVEGLPVLEHGWAVARESQVLWARFPLCLLVGTVGGSLRGFGAVVVAFRGWSLVARSRGEEYLGRPRPRYARY